MSHQNRRRLAPFLTGVIPAIVVGAIASTNAAAQYSGDSLVKGGQHEENLYLAGATVLVDADVVGDVVVAGGNVVVSRRVADDVLAAGGTLTITADVGDDVRAAGGSVSITNTVAGEVVAAGGDVTLGPGSAVGGRTWLAGGSLNLGGQIHGDVAVAGSTVILSGEFHRDVNVFAESLTLTSTAVIRGNLSYQGPQPAVLETGARVFGETLFTHSDVDFGQELTAHELLRHQWSAAGVVFAVLAFSSLLISLIMPRTSVRAARIAGDEWLKSILMGLVVLFITPPLAILLTFTFVLAPLGVALFLFYFVLLILALFIGVIFLANVIFRLLSYEPGAARWKRAGAVVVAAALLSAVTLLPVAGAVIGTILLLLGLGAFTLQLFRSATDTTPPKRLARAEEDDDFA